MLLEGRKERFMHKYFNSDNLLCNLCTAFEPNCLLCFDFDLIVDLIVIFCYIVFCYFWSYYQQW